MKPADCDIPDADEGRRRMRTVRQFINGVLEAGNWDIRDAFDDIMARDAEHEEEKAAVRAYATRLEAALVRSHACPTVRDDGECDGCYVSEALATWPPVVAAEASMSIDSGKLTPKCASCEETNATVRRRDGTGEPDADLCDECIAEHRRNDMDPVQY